MAQLKDLLVNGLSRFIGETYFNDNAIFNSAITLNDTATFNGLVTLNDTLILTKMNDLSGTANTSPALIIGGTPTVAHIEIDSNEIMAKNNATTTTDLFLNYEGGVVHIGNGGLKITANKAATAIDTGALQVKGGIYAGATSWLTGATINGATLINSTLTVKNTSTMRNINPEANNTYSLGASTSSQWLKLWVKDIAASNDTSIGGGLVVSGLTTLNGNLDTNGDVTIGNATTDVLTINSNSIFNNGLRVIKGHLYLEGAKASSSMDNTTQLVFGTPTNNHVALSSNTNALVINPTTSSASPQIVLYIRQPSSFPSGITTNHAGASGPLTVGGATVLKSTLLAEGETNLNGSVKLGDAAADIITINGVSTFKANVTMEKTLTVTGTTTTNGILTANGNVNLGNATSDITTIKSTVKVTSGLSSTSKTTGAIIVTGGIGVSEQINAQSFRIDNAVKFVYNNTDKCVDVIFD